MKVPSPPPEISAAVERVFPAEEGVAGGRFPEWKPSSVMDARGLLYLDDWTLNALQCAAVAEAASQLGDERCYFSWVDRDVWPAAIQDFELDELTFDRYSELLDRGAVLNHVVVSLHGQWGVYITDEGVAVVAGPESFVTSVYRSLPPMKEQATRYASDMLTTEIPGLIAWVTELLTEILGTAEAAAILSSAKPS
jgi:hypothetical protein